MSLFSRFKRSKSKKGRPVTLEEWQRATVEVRNDPYAGMLRNIEKERLFTFKTDIKGKEFRFDWDNKRSIMRDITYLLHNMPTDQLTRDREKVASYISEALRQKKISEGELTAIYVKNAPSNLNAHAEWVSIFSEASRMVKETKRGAQKNKDKKNNVEMYG